MNTEKIVQEARAIMVTCAVIGFLLLGSGIALSMMGVSFIDNNKAIIGLIF